MNAVTPVNKPVIWFTIAYDNGVASLATKNRAMNLITRTIMYRITIRARPDDVFLQSFHPPVSPVKVP